MHLRLFPDMPKSGDWVSELDGAGPWVELDLSVWRSER